MSKLWMKISAELSRASDSSAFLITDLEVVFWKDVGEMERSGSGFYSEPTATEM